MLDRDFHAVDRAENASAHFVEGLRELFDLAERLDEKFIKPRAECGVVGGDRGQHAGMIERRIQPRFNSRTRDTMPESISELKSR